MADWRTALPGAPDDWLERLLALPRQEGTNLARAILEAWADGTLELELAPEPRDVEALRGLRHVLAALVTGLESQGFDLSIITGDLNIDEAAVRRWCWIEPWALIEQDEDLFLMSEHLFVPLLDEAAAGCPKRDYAISIVEHAIRDEANGVLRTKPDDLHPHLASASRWIPHARRAKASKLADYCERLSRYAEVARVDADGAIDRAKDLRRCAPAVAPLIERHDHLWFVDISSFSAREEALVIEVGSGRMRAEKWPKAAL